MKKIVVEKAGGYNQLQLKVFPTPQPKKNEILIETYACGVNFADCCVRMGVYSSANEFVGWPITPGFEVSGIITAIGDEVKKFSCGQKVIATTLFGGYTTHLIVSEETVFPMPERLSFVEAASIPAVFLTAYYGLFELAHPKKDNLILIHSAAGGVGSALTQICKLAGSDVMGVVGAPHKVEIVKSLGANTVIDKSTQNLWDEAEKFAPGGFDIIFDANGVETLSQSYQHLRAGGKLVVYGFHTMFSKGRGTPNWIKMAWDYIRTPRFDPLKMTQENRSVLAFNLSYLFDRLDLFQASMHTILRWVEEEKIVIPPVKVYPLEKAAEAHRDLETGQTVGKLILTTK